MFEQNILFISVLSVFFILAIVVVTWPLRSYKKVYYGLIMAVTITAGGLYYFLGSYSLVVTYNKEQARDKLAKKALSEFKSVDEIIDKLKLVITQEPSNPQGWYLLGKLYLSDKRYLLARDTFLHAYNLEPNNFTYAFLYMQSLYFDNNKKDSELANNLLTQLLIKYPQEPELINFAAMDAYSNKKYKKSIVYWKKLMLFIPKGSDAEQAILTALEKAQTKIE